MPEKQTVEDQCRSAATVAKPLNNTRRTWTTLEYRPSLRPLTDGPGRRAHSYGSEGWGFESLRARQAHRPVARPAVGFLFVLGATLGATGTHVSSRTGPGSSTWPPPACHLQAGARTRPW